MGMLSARLGTLAIACALTLGAATGTLGCKKLFKGIKGATLKDAGVSTTSAGNTPQDDADEQMLDKLDAYIICLNTLSNPVHQTRARYFSWVDPKKGVTGNEKVVLGLFDIPNETVSTCTQGLTKSRTSPPRDSKLEAAGDEFAKTVTELDVLIEEVFSYYETKAFKNDKFAKGKAMHPRLIAAFANFSRADNNMHATLDGITKPLAQRTLARIEREDGRKFRWNRKNVLISARELVEAGDPIGDDDNIDFALCSASFTVFDKALNDLAAYALTHRNDLSTPQTTPGAASHFDQFSRAADDYRKVSSEYLRCLQNAPAKARTATGKIDPDKLPPCPAGRKNDAVGKYNQLIRTSNENQFP